MSGISGAKNQPSFISIEKDNLLKVISLTSALDNYVRQLNGLGTFFDTIE
jgi:hypothetical protein